MTSTVQLQAMVDKVVDGLPELSADQCRRVAAVLHSSGALDLSASADQGKPAAKVDALLNRNEVAERLGVSTRWLIRNAADVPNYFKLPGGMIRYREADIEKWLIRNAAQGPDFYKLPGGDDPLRGIGPREVAQAAEERHVTSTEAGR